MKKMFGTGLLIMGLCFSVGSVSAENAKSLSVYAATGDCTAAFGNLTATTSGATSLTSKELSGLVKISTDASNLCVIGKTADALKKLYDYREKLDQLAATFNTPKPKISVQDEQALRLALNEAIGCVSPG